MHNVWDPGVPAFHETELRRVVDAAGKGHMLRQELKPSYAHCDINASEAVGAFGRLVGWAVPD